MTIIALIPARGGSKGIYKKNLADLGNGENLLGRTIQHAKSSYLVHETYVSTEDQDIDMEAMYQGARVIHRPGKLASDEATTESVVQHAIESLNLGGNDTIVLLQCTSPFRSEGQIDQAIQKFVDTKCDSLASVRPLHSHRWLYAGHNAKWAPMPKRKRRQDQDELFIETGSFYIFSVESFIRNNNRLGEHSVGFVVPECDAMDVDTEFDLKTVRALLRYEG